MKKNYVIKLFAIFCIVLFAFQANTISISAIVCTERIKGEIVGEDTITNDLSTIKIEIYKLVEEEDNDNDYSQFEHVYISTISPDSDGEFFINKTSNLYYVKILTETLPYGIGVLNSSILIDDSGTELIFQLKSVDEIVYDNNGKKLAIDEDGNTLHVNRDYLNSLELNTTTLELPFYDDIDNNVNTKAISINETANLLEANNFETEEDFYKTYENLWQQSLDSNRNSLSNSLNYNYVPEYTNESQYTRLGFTLHYENGNYTDALLRAITTQFNYAKTSLCSTFCFLIPPFKTDGSDNNTYHIFLDPSLSYAGVTLKYLGESNGSSYIVLKVPYTQTSLTEYYQGLIVHEYMHAVQYAYAPAYNANLYTFNEATAHLAKISCVRTADISSSVNKFQNTPEKSLFNNENNRGAGGVLFPLYIKEHYSGLNTIRTIYEKYSSSISKNIYTAIDDTLQLSNSSLKDAYTGFRAASYNISSYYNFYQSTWTNTPKKTALYEDYVTYTMPLMSALYFEHINTGFGKYFTFNFGTEHGNTADKLDLQCIVTDSSGDATIYQQTFTGSYCTVSYYLNTDAKVCFILSNVSTSESEEICASVM